MALPVQELSPCLLTDAGGQAVSFPGERPALICVVKEDCPTCREVMPVLEALHSALAPYLDLYLVGQTLEGNRLLAQKHAGLPPLLDDSGLKASFAWRVDVVPSLFVPDATGEMHSKLEGFSRAEWQDALAALAERLNAPSPIVDWTVYPEWRAGCGSLSADPVNAVRLQAESANSPLRARRIELGAQEDPVERLFELGFGDGLPLTPPTPERVLDMLAGTERPAQEVVAIVPPNLGEATVEKVAINAVMAGCTPACLPVVLAALEAVCTDEFNIHGVMATTMGAAPVLVVNGPIRKQLGMNMQLGALGQGNRANATIGRALRLAIRNLGGAVPGGTERSTLGSPLKITMCFPEWEERSPWQPLHVERGFAEEDSVVTAFAASSGPTLMVDQDARTGAHLAGSFGLCLDTVFHPRARRATEVLLVIAPEHVDTFVRDGYDKAMIRARIQAVTARPIAELAADEVSAVGFSQEALEAMGEEASAHTLSKFRRDEDIHIVVAGAEAGKFTGAFHGWVTGPVGSVSVSRRIESTVKMAGS